MNSFMGAGGCGALASFCTMTCFCCFPSWRAPRYILGMSEARHDRVRKKFHILVEGEGIPPPIKSFKEMKFPAGRPGEEPGRDPTFFLAVGLRDVCHWWKSCYLDLSGKREEMVQVVNMGLSLVL